MNFDNLEKRTIFLTVYGSHAYGLSNPESDWDYRGICIPPIKSYINLVSNFEQITDTLCYKYFKVGLLNSDPRVDPSFPPPDMQVMELTKFAHLASECNPSVLEVLFTDKKFHVISHPIMETLFNNKELFLCKRIGYSFSGYAISQLKRIKTHKKWIDNPPAKMPTREEFGLPEMKVNINDHLGAAYSLIDRSISEIDLDKDLSKEIILDIKKHIERIIKSVWQSINEKDNYPIGADQPFQSIDDALFWNMANKQGFPKNLLDLLNREKQYRAAKSNWDSYQNWKTNRNKKRAELELKYKMDTKHAMHLVRLMKMCKEILQTGEIKVERPDAEFLLDVRNGKYSYDEVLKFAEDSSNEIDELMKTTSLPNKPQINKINDIVFDMIMNFNKDFNYV